MNKYQIGDWVYNENYGAGRITDRVISSYHATEYRVKFNGEWRSIQMQEARLTKIEHNLRPGHKVRFHAWQYDREGIITRITPEYVDIESDFNGKFTRHYTTVTKIADEQPKADLPLPPNFDTLKNTKTVIGNYTLTNVDPDVVRIMYGVDLAQPKDSLVIRETKGYLDAKIKRAELDLKKQQDDLAKLREARAKL